jgi:hypothetical protein
VALADDGSIHAIILYGRGSAAPEDEKVCLDLTDLAGENSLAFRQKGRGPIGGMTPSDNLTCQRLTHT